MQQEDLKVVKVVGPKDVERTYDSNGWRVQLSGGVAKSTHTDGTVVDGVPQEALTSTLWAIGFYVEPNGNAQQVTD